MPLVAHSDHPAFDTLRGEGIDVCAPEDASAELPHLHVGLLNLMPDAALRATDRQFIRLVCAHADAANLYVHPFTVAAQHRSEPAKEYLGDYHENFPDLRRGELDGLIITGANPARADLREETFWEPLVEVMDWGRKSVRSILCSCLATHAVLLNYYGVQRARLPQKRWGVYSHDLLVEGHPLLTGISSPFDAPHSHNYDVSRATMEQVGVRVLAESREAGVHMAVSEDQFSFVFFQGHPEYDAISLLKEYKREVDRFLAGERDYPPYPDHYFGETAVVSLERHKMLLTREESWQRDLPRLPEEEISKRVSNTWLEAGGRIYSNWLAELHRRKEGGPSAAKREPNRG